jgi:hypothetical protein
VRPSQRCVGIWVPDASRARERADRDAALAGTRSAYRRTTGWRVDLTRLAGAVHLYAPGLPVIDGRDRHQRG